MSAGPLVIGLAGGTGSGKTTVAKALLAAAGDGNALLLPQDAYYRAQGDLPFEARVLTNYDEPSAFDSELLVRHVDQLKAGNAVARPVYDFQVHDRAAETVRLEPAPVIIVEGILVLHDQHLRERMGLKVFIDAPPDERFIRRLERDVAERGRSAQAVIDQYRRTVKPMHDLFVEPTKQYADLVLPEGGKNRVALEVLFDHIDGYLRRRRRGEA
ncbi:MAG: uridine kinase [Trueperaceae bacterium]|jgi:uridine kinase|nr:uridine kinase [Truepera sp.]HRN17561.1 uridine kinase [Trueperaceae bacterium]HRQ09868.1 uridine kinase [Trueperaceae bacterium]